MVGINNLTKKGFLCIKLRLVIYKHKNIVMTKKEQFLSIMADVDKKIAPCVI